MNAILQNWSVFRLIRLALGIMMIVQAFETKDPLPGIVGLLFSVMALFNFGCCSTTTCNANFSNQSNKAAEIEYEEVK